MSQVSLLQISQSEHGLRLWMLMTRSRVGMSMAGLGGKELLVVAAHLKARPNEPKSCAQREAQAAVLAKVRVRSRTFVLPHHHHHHHSPTHPLAHA